VFCIHLLTNFICFALFGGKFWVFCRWWNCIGDKVEIFLSYSQPMTHSPKQATTARPSATRSSPSELTFARACIGSSISNFCPPPPPPPPLTPYITRSYDFLLVQNRFYLKNFKQFRLGITLNIGEDEYEQD